MIIEHNMNILILKQPGAMGANLLILPTVNYLRKLYPAAHIEWSGHATVGSLAPVNLVHPQVPLSFPGALKFIDKYDIVLSWLGEKINAQVTGKTKAVWINMVNEKIDVPLYKQYMNQVCAALKTEVPATIDFGLPPLKSSRYNTALLLPYGNVPMKQWRTREWVSLATKLPIAPLLISDGRSKPVAEAILAARKCEWIHWPDTKNMIDRLCGMTNFVGLDTGLSHLAGALGLPGVCVRFEFSKGWDTPGPVKPLTLRATADDVLKALA